MKTKRCLVLTLAGPLLVGGTLVACDTGTGKKDPVLESHMDKLSYTMGFQAGKNIGAQQIEINTEIYLRGLFDGVYGQKPLLSNEQIRETVAMLQKEIMAKREVQQKKLAQQNKNDGDSFLAENGKKEGVVTLPSGLQYKVVKAGTGKKPNESDTVTAHYRGTLLDGTEFDSSLKRGKPASFPVAKVIKGWREALMLMDEGAKWQVVIPGNLAYGERGGPQGSGIGPNTTVIFDIELLSVQQKPDQEKPPVKGGATKNRS